MAKTETKGKTAEYVVARGIVTTGYLKPATDGRVAQQVLKHHRPGDTVVIDVDEAEQLLADGIITDPRNAPPPPAPLPLNAAPKEGVTITQDTGPKVQAPPPAPAKVVDEV